MDTESEVRAELSANRGLFLGVGILLMILGAGAILLPAVASLGATIFAGWVLVIGAVFMFASAFSKHGADVAIRLLWAVLTLIAGLYLLINPGEGTETLTLVLVIYFIAMGLIRLGAAFSLRGNPGVGWVAVNGLLSLLIGLLVLIDFPGSADWAIGLLIGIDFIFAGWVLIMFSSSIKQLDQSS